MFGLRHDAGDVKGGAPGIDGKVRASVVLEAPKQICGEVDPFADFAAKEGMDRQVGQFSKRIQERDFEDGHRRVVDFSEGIVSGDLAREGAVKQSGIDGVETSSVRVFRATFHRVCDWSTPTPASCSPNTCRYSMISGSP